MRRPRTAWPGLAGLSSVQDVKGGDRAMTQGDGTGAVNGRLDGRLDGEVTVIVDGANVVGSRPDGWWRDRAGAAVRLHDNLAKLAERGHPGIPAGGLAP